MEIYKKAVLLFHKLFVAEFKSVEDKKNKPLFQ